MGVSRVSPEQLLEGLTPPQSEAVTHAQGPLLVLAGPGSGKTRVITHRAAYLALTVTRPYRVLTITFTNKAAGEMAHRLERIGIEPGITCSTFHAFCAKLLRIHHEAAGIRPDYSIYDTADQLDAMKEAVRRLNLSKDNFPPAGMLAVVSKAKNAMITAGELRERACGWQDQKLADLYAAYDAVLAEQNALDFDDLLLRTAWMLRDREEVRARLGEKYQYILVDEYQDTNRAQYLIARGLALDHQNLCVTGDPDQSIYTWRGADVGNILAFEEDFPSAKVVRLEQNYRSTPQILSAADAVIAHNNRRKVKSLFTENGAGSPVRLVECESHTDEADYIAREIRRYADQGGVLSQVAIFYRMNALSRSVEAALRYAHVPYQIARGVAFYQRKEIKDTLAYLRAVVNPLDGVSLLRIINVPTRGIGKTSVQRLMDYALDANIGLLEAVRRAEQIAGLGRAVPALKSFAQLMHDITATARHGTVQDALEFALRSSGLIAMYGAAQDDDALANVEELINAAAEYDRQHADGSGSLIDWLATISLVSDTDAIDPQVGAVTLMTLHAAKGLEFDQVYLMGLEEGVLPHQRSEMEQGDVEEERRLCFVGMTRARQRLTLTYAKWRDVRGATMRQTRSRFLRELPAKEIETLSVGQGGVPHSDEDDQGVDLPASSLDFLEWRRGQLVRHKKYGVGRVLWIQPRNRQTHAGIKFTSHGEKTLVLEFANLEVLDED